VYIKAERDYEIGHSRGTRARLISNLPWELLGSGNLTHELDLDPREPTFSTGI